MVKNPPKVLIYHTALSENPTKDDLDVIDERNFVSDILKEIGYEVDKMPFYGNIKKDIERIRPSFIFNLVEAVEGKDSLAYIAPMVFEEFGIPYTGCPLSSFEKTESKTKAKEILIREGILTPYLFDLTNLQDLNLNNKKFLIKSDINHASKDLSAILLEGADDIKKELNSKGSDFFAEEYIKGREFNISVVGSLGKGEVLSPAEILFKKWPSDKLKIIDYDAKWNENSYAYKNTKRTFNFPEADNPLLEKLKQISGECWNLFDLRGYARVDFRVDEENNPYVLEINANPCISKDAGFIAATRKSGMKKEQVIRDIIKNSCGKKFVI